MDHRTGASDEPIVDVAGFARFGAGDRTVPSDTELLDEVALTINSSLELGEVLRELAELALRVFPATRASVFLIEDRCLHPAVSIATEPDPQMWSAFRDMEPVALEERPDGWAMLLAGLPVAVEDADTSPLIPDGWAERFGVESVVLTPLVASDGPWGLMAIEHTAADLPDEFDLERLGALGTYAGMVVRNARTLQESARRARLREALAQGSAALTRQGSAREIAEALADAYTELLGARACGIGLFDAQQTRLTPLATRGTRPAQGPIETSLIPTHVTDRARAAWAEGTEPLRIDDPWFDRIVGSGAGHLRYVVLPLMVDGALRGAVLLGYADQHRLDDEQIGAAQALASMTSSALERTSLHDRLERQVRRFEILNDLAIALAGDGGADQVLDHLNELLSGYGVEVVSLALRDRRLRRFLGSPAPTAEERRSWRGQREPVAMPDGTLSVPMRLGRRHAGSLRVRPASLDDEDRSFLEALARGVVEVVNRGALNAEVELADRERALASERSRIAADLHDSVGQLFVALGLMARRSTEHLPPDSPWVDELDRIADLADGGKQEVNDAIRALGQARKGAGPSLTRDPAGTRTPSQEVEQ